MSATAGSLRPIVVVLEDAYDARTLAAGVLFHFHEHGIALGQGGPRGFLRLEGQHATIVGPDIGPDPFAIFHFNLEHGDLRAARARIERRHAGAPRHLAARFAEVLCGSAHCSPSDVREPIPGRDPLCTIAWTVPRNSPSINAPRNDAVGVA